jgi:multisubunit Na+/H+ antiporter MnhG subunit
MAWIDDESRWESGETGFGVGRTLYWLTTTIAAIIVVFAVADFFISWAQGAPIVRVFAFMAAALVWLIGRACRAPLS